jgi:hypothetical protein
MPIINLITIQMKKSLRNLLFLCLTLLVCSVKAQVSDTTFYSDDFSNGLAAWTPKEGTWTTSNNELNAFYSVVCGSIGCPQGDLILNDQYQVQGNWRASVDFIVTPDQEFSYRNDAYPQFTLWGDNSKKVNIGLGDGMDYLPTSLDSTYYSLHYWNGSWFDQMAKKVHYHWQNDQWNTASIQKIGSTYQIYLNNLFLFEFVDTFLNGTGKIGLHCYGTKRLDNFKLESQKKVFFEGFDGINLNENRWNTSFWGYEGMVPEEGYNMLVNDTLQIIRGTSADNDGTYGITSKFQLFDVTSISCDVWLDELHNWQDHQFVMESPIGTIGYYNYGSFWWVGYYDSTGTYISKNNLLNNYVPGNKYTVKISNTNDSLIFQIDQGSGLETLFKTASFSQNKINSELFNGIRIGSGDKGCTKIDNIEAIFTGISSNLDLQSDGLVAYYPFNGNGNDESGNGNSAIQTGIISFENTPNGQGAVFNNPYGWSYPEDQYFTLPYSSTLQSLENSSFTISALYKSNDLGRVNGRLMGSQKEGKTSGIAFIYNSQMQSFAYTSIISDTVRFDPGWQNPDTQTSFVTDGIYHLQTLVLDRENHFIRYYVDNRLIDSVLYQTLGTLSFDDFTIGSLYGSSAARNTTIDEVRIYNRPLLSSEIDSLYQFSILPEQAFVIGNVSVNEELPIMIPISVNDLSADINIISYQFDITYNNTALSYTGNTLTGTIAEGGSIVVNTTVPGKLSISYMNSTALLGTGNILKLQFNALSFVTTSLTISNAYLNNTPIENLTNGIVTVNDVTPPSASITYDDTDIRFADALTITATFSEAMDAANAVKLSLSGAATLADAEMTRQSATVYTYSYSVPKADGAVTISLSNGTDLSANAVVSTPTSGGSFTIVKLSYGDVDDDGKILAYDAALTLQHSVGLNPLPAIDPIPWENWRVATADVDGVTDITANDAALILQYSAGIITTFTPAGKKSSAASSTADVTVEVVNNEIVFYSAGELYGLNISTINQNQILGTPNVLAGNFMTAFNINGTTYNLGLCTAYSPAEGVAIMKIPYNSNGSVSFNMIVNTLQKTVTVDLVTGMVEFSNDRISIYPNPVKDRLNISGLTGNTIANIYNTNGKLVKTSHLANPTSEISVSDLSAGLYTIKLQTNKEIAAKRFIIK